MKLKRVLVVDDDASIREIAAFALEEVAGLEVRTCADGREAVETAADWQADVVVLDLMMPGMDGQETLVALKDRLGEFCPPVVFLTARGRAGDGVSLRALGAAGVLSKPFDPLTLGERLADLLEGGGPDP